MSLAGYFAIMSASVYRWDRTRWATGVLEYANSGAACDARLQQRLAEGRIEQGLAQLEQASKEAPRNPEYRSTLFRQRELAVNQLLAQGEAARKNNDLKEAEAVYR